jgi:hypothetical protein
MLAGHRQHRSFQLRFGVFGPGKTGRRLGNDLSQDVGRGRIIRLGLRVRLTVGRLRPLATLRLLTC